MINVASHKLNGLLASKAESERRMLNEMRSMMNANAPLIAAAAAATTTTPYGSSSSNSSSNSNNDNDFDRIPSPSPYARMEQMLGKERADAFIAEQAQWYVDRLDTDIEPEQREALRRLARGEDCDI